jgi:hypothetical protein
VALHPNGHSKFGPVVVFRLMPAYTSGSALRPVLTYLMYVPLRLWQTLPFGSA